MEALFEGMFDDDDGHVVAGLVDSGYCRELHQCRIPKKARHLRNCSFFP